MAEGGSDLSDSVSRLTISDTQEALDTLDIKIQQHIMYRTLIHKLFSAMLTSILQIITKL